MLRLHQLTLSPDEALQAAGDQALLRRLCARRLGLREDEIACLKIAKRSVDARRDGVRFAYTVDISLKKEAKEATVIRRFRPNEAALLPGRADAKRTSPLSAAISPWKAAFGRPVVVGAGPAGLFCALVLAMRGANPLILERGKPVEERVHSIALLEEQGILDPESNVLFGEGGAGTFSDGKLTCGLHSPWTETVLEILTECGAPEEILTAAKAHIGTDELRKVLLGLRKKIQSLGGEFHFGTRLTGLELRDGSLRSVRCVCNGQSAELPCEKLFLAIGHSARDTVRMLYDSGIPMAQKPFAVGVRIEHLQSSINRAQYGAMAEHPALPAADYKLNVHTPDGRGVYTFCMCPGGRVINASNEANMLNVNGMSLHARNGKNANAALLVGVWPEDFGNDHPLAGIDYQRRIEAAAFARTACLKAPCQRVEDFLMQRESRSFGEVQPSYLPGVMAASLDAILPGRVLENLRFALPQLGKKLRGFDCPDALLTGPETRSSSPVRILRNEDGESEIKGLYPLGEGAGYAGGIISAALDGLQAALRCGKDTP